VADPISVSGPVSGTDKTLTFETGRFAPQSMGAVVASIGGTTVLTTANAASSVREGMDFFPLTVDVEERAYAAGKIPGSFFRREGRPTEEAILNSLFAAETTRGHGGRSAAAIDLEAVRRWVAPR